MPQQGVYPAGAPCWADVTTPDLDSAKRFYTGVFGWELEQLGADHGNYCVARLGGRSVAGIRTTPEDSALPPSWTVYLWSDDVDETARRVGSGGGKLLMAPVDVSDAGRMLMAADPTGAVFACWQPGAQKGAHRYGEPGSMCWADVHTSDSVAVDEFYRSLFDYEPEPSDSLGHYSVWKLGGQMVCGRVQTGPQASAQVPPHWMVHFAVADTDATVAAILKAGGVVRMEPTDSQWGRYAVVADPHQATFSVVTPPQR